MYFPSDRVLHNTVVKNPKKVIQKFFVNQFDNPKNIPKNAIVNASSIFANEESMKNPIKKKAPVKILVTVRFVRLFKLILSSNLGRIRNANKLIPSGIGKNNRIYFNTTSTE